MEKKAPSKFIEVCKCPVCHAVDRRKLFTIPDSVVYECGNCYLRYLDPCLSTDAMASLYESDETLQKAHKFHENYYDYGDLAKPSRTRKDFEKALQILENRIPSAGERKIFDVGYGNGFFLALAKKRGWSVDGIDTSPQNAEIARNKFGLNLRIGLWNGAESPSEKFQAVSFWDVLEHLSDPHQMVRMASTALAPGGVILVAVPHDKSFLMRFSAFLYHATKGRFRKGIEQIYLMEHVCYYHMAPLVRLFEMNGFRATDCFFSRTDLDKYKLSFADKIIASIILILGKWFSQENRLVVFFQKIP